MSIPPSTPEPRAPDPILLACGALQIAAAFTPAAHVRIVGAIPFIRLPTAGGALIALGVATMLVALRTRGWWRGLSPLCSALVLGVSYWRLVFAPSATFVDPLVRRAVHPSWGFVPMSAIVVLALWRAMRPSRA